MSAVAQQADRRAPDRAGITPADKRLTLAAATLGSFVALLDSTVVSIALPAISTDLGGGLESQQWIVNAYLLMLGSLILIGGSLGDVFGERRLFVLGAAGFGIASVGCALAPSVGALIAARGLQGVFGALLTPASLALIIAAFRPDERGRAIGTWTAYSGIAAVVGPLVGGWLVDALSWRWIFAINLPFILVALMIATQMPAAAGSRLRRRPDWLGAGLCAIGLAGPTFGLVRQPGLGWAHPLVDGPIVTGVAMFALFLLWERRGTADPMLPLGLFRRRNFTRGNVETVLIYGGLGLLFFVLVVFLQQSAGYRALEAGAATIPTTVVLFLLAKRFGALADSHGPRLFSAAARWCRRAACSTCSRGWTRLQLSFATSYPVRPSSRSGSRSSLRRSRRRFSPTPTRAPLASRPASTTRSRASPACSRPPPSVPWPAARWTSAAFGWRSRWSRACSPSVG